MRNFVNIIISSIKYCKFMVLGILFADPLIWFYHVNTFGYLLDYITS